MSKDVDHNWTWQPEEGNQPEESAQREEPKFFARPKPLGHGRARKDSEKCLAKNCAGWQQKHCEDKLHPTRRDYERRRCRNPESIRSPRDVSDNLPVAFGVTPSA